MFITHEELIATAKNALLMRQNTPKYKFIKRYQLLIIAETMIGLGEWMEARGTAQGNCGCLEHTDHSTN